MLHLLLQMPAAHPAHTCCYKCCTPLLCGPPPGLAWLCSLLNQLPPNPCYASLQARSFADFLLPMLNFVPGKRATAGQMLKHPWLRGEAATASGAAAGVAARKASGGSSARRSMEGRHSQQKQRSHERSRSRTRSPKRSRLVPPPADAACFSCRMHACLLPAEWVQVSDPAKDGVAA